jgi:hypothetical protein
MISEKCGNVRGTITTVASLLVDTIACFAILALVCGDDAFTTSSARPIFFASGRTRPTVGGARQTREFSALAHSIINFFLAQLQPASPWYLAAVCINRLFDRSIVIEQAP